eukprot:c45171_g1_i1 orf=18-227(-)
MSPTECTRNTVHQWIFAKQRTKTSPMHRKLVPQHPRSSMYDVLIFRYVAALLWPSFDYSSNSSGINLKK